MTLSIHRTTAAEDLGTAEALADADVVFVRDDCITLSGFQETDPRVVQVVGEAADPEATVHQMLELGARCIVDTGSLLQAQTVATEFERMKHDFEQTVVRHAEAVTKLTEAVIGEGGAIPKAMSEFHADLAASLGDAFDEDSKSSILAKFDAVMEQQRQQLVKSLAEQMDLGRDDSPLAQTRRALLEGFEGLAKSVTGDITELTKNFAAEKARAAAAEKGTGKGLTYQAALHEAVQPLVAVFEDIAEFVGNTTGVTSGKKVGDEIVALNRSSTGGHTVRYVLEAKDQKMSSLEKVLEEIGDAMTNREALVGIAVFSSQAKAPTSTPLQVFDGGRKVVVVADKLPDGEFSTEGLLALRLACSWARWTAIREVMTEAPIDGIDTHLILEAVRRAQEALALASTVRTAHTTATNKIELAASQVDKICEAAAEALTVIEKEIARAGEGGGA